MSRVRILLGPQDFRAQAPALSHQIAINLFAAEAPPGADVKYGLYYLPGTENWISVGTGPFRGYHVFLDELFVVSGSTLYRINSAGEQTNLGTVPGTIEEKVWMEDDGLKLLIVTGESDGYSGYQTNGTAAVAAVSDPDFPQAAWAVFMDQQIIVGTVDTQQVQWGAVADLTDWDALDFASAEYAPDKLVRGIRDHSDLLLLGSKTLEVWYNAGDAEATFQRAPDGVIDIGCAAARSPATLDNAVYFLAIDQGGLSFRRLEGRTPVKVSHEGVEQQLARATTVSDAYGFTFTHQGHAFYVCTLPTAGQTHVYDRATQFWYSWRSQGYNYWRPLGVVECFGRLLVIDTITNKVGRMSPTCFTEFGSQIPWEITGAPLSSQLRSGIASRFLLEIESGTALRSGQGSNPYMFLTWSEDDGKTWVNPKRKAMGATGSHKVLTWTRLGRGNKRLFKLYGAEPIGTGLIQAFADAGVEQV